MFVEITWAEPATGYYCSVVEKKEPADKENKRMKNMVGHKKQLEVEKLIGLEISKVQSDNSGKYIA